MPLAQKTARRVSIRERSVRRQLRKDGIMSKVRVNCFSVSVDGYAAGPGQNLENPLGVRGTELHQWFYPTATFQRMFADGQGTTGVDDDFARRGGENVGAWILGRNMFGPVRGAWPDESWQGWWGENPPYHTPVFVLTHHPRPSLQMAGGTIFHFVTDGAEAALERAKQAAGDRDVRIGGGAATIRQYLRAGAIDELHLAISPILLGGGEHLLSGIDLPKLGYRISEHVPSPAVTHLVLSRP
jgi:dihydrofolate reductase